jgi:tetratricopeptide (TPR) repeat protein
MDHFSRTFLREHKFPLFNSVKRVIKEGSGPSITANCLIKYTQEVYRGTDLSNVNLNPCQVYRFLSLHAQDPENSLPALFQILFTMRLNEEAWTLIPSGYHQENDEAWDDLYYHLTVTSIESFESLTPINQKFLSECQIGPEGKILKRVLSEGQGNYPPFNYLVTYYYTSFKMDGTEFESYTSKCHILPRVPLQDTHAAIYYALLTMREGEDCVVLSPPEYFKPNYKNNLWFSIQLLYISEPSNCCYPQKINFLDEVELGEGVVKRKIVEGTGDELVNVNKIWIEIEGWLEDSYQFQKRKEECVNYLKDRVFPISQKLLFPTMKRGEVSFIKCPPGTHVYADSLETETIWVKYTLKEYLEYFEDPIRLKDYSERIELCKKIKDSANRIYRSNIRSESKVLYNKVNSGLVFKNGVVDSFDPNLKNEYNTLKVAVLGNLALVFLKDAEDVIEKDRDQAEKYLKKVIEYTTSDLELNPINSKALYRRSKSLFMKEEFEKAKNDLTAALEIEPNNKDCLNLLKEINKELKVEEKKQKTIFREVFKDENWRRESEKEEERIKRINDENDLIQEKEEEEEISKWIHELNTKGVHSTQADAINLLIDDSDDDENIQGS